jgi:hypothetical protein
LSIPVELLSGTSPPKLLPLVLPVGESACQQDFWQVRTRHAEPVVGNPVVSVEEVS